MALTFGEFNPKAPLNGFPKKTIQLATFLGVMIRPLAKSGEAKTRARVSASEPSVNEPKNIVPEQMSCPELNALLLTNAESHCYTKEAEKCRSRYYTRKIFAAQE